MEYPLPENMGFARRTITDMLPEEIAEADMAAIKRHVQRETMGLRECTCAECGMAFMAHAQHRYRRKSAMYCSYKCYRVEERRREEASKAPRLNAWSDKRGKTPKELAEERLVACRKKCEAWKGRQCGKEWDGATREQRRRIAERAAYWHARLVLAEEELEEAERREGEKKDTKGD